tara:strand:+ start:21255 stop:21464 length:210 start_codon:yes stop_codon:yes gene_type:complete
MSVYYVTWKLEGAKSLAGGFVQKTTEVLSAGDGFKLMDILEDHVKNLETIKKTIACFGGNIFITGVFKL